MYSRNIYAYSTRPIREKGIAKDLNAKISVNSKVSIVKRRLI